MPRARPGRHPFSLGYGVVLPSSLAMVPPIASVSSTCPPVSVLVRAPARLHRGFSRGHGRRRLHPVASSRASALAAADFPAAGLRAFTGTSRTPPGCPSPSPRLSMAARRRCGNVRPLRIGHASRPRLSTRLTLGGLAFPRKPWTSGGGVSHAPLATHASILAPARSTARSPCRFAPRGSLPYRRARRPAPPLRRRA